MTTRYGPGLQRVRWLLDGIERRLAVDPDGSELSRVDLRGIVPGRRTPDDELVAALNALEDIGILEPTARGWRLNKTNFERTEGYRRGVRQGLDLEESVHRREKISLLASLPVTVVPDARARVFRDALDL